MKAIDWVRNQFERHRSASFNRNPKREPVLSFGGVLGKDPLIQGGKVKLLDLQHAFPINENEFNILYLVSSSLPANFQKWIDRSKALKIPFVLNQNGVGYPAWAGKQVERINAPLKAAIHAADYVIYQSEFCKKSSDQYLGVIRAPHQVLFNPVDLEIFKPQKAPSFDQPWLLLLGGSQYQKYRIFGALEILSVLKERGIHSKLTIAGKVNWTGNEAACTAEVRARAKSLDLDDWVSFTGPFSRKQAPTLYREHHLLLHSKMNDPCPTTVIESLASGLPVVYSDSGGVPELVSNGAGIGIATSSNYENEEFPDPKLWADGIIALISRLPQAQSAARKCALEHFNAKIWINKHRQIFESLLVEQKDGKAFF